jgi:hypothetical protein
MRRSGRQLWQQHTVDEMNDTVVGCVIGLDHLGLVDPDPFARVVSVDFNLFAVQCLGLVHLAIHRPVIVRSSSGSGVALSLTRNVISCDAIEPLTASTPATLRAAPSIFVAQAEQSMPVTR